MTSTSGTGGCPSGQHVLPVQRTVTASIAKLQAQKDRPYPQFSNVTIVAPSFGVSNYHAAVVKFEKRFSRGLNILSTYTYAKFLDNAGSGGGTLGNEVSSYSNLYNRRADYGPTENDVRHRLTWSSVYELPFGAGRAHLAKSPLRFVLGGWSVGSVAMVQSAAPFTVTTQTNTTNAFSAGNLRADVLRNPNLSSDQRTLGRWFDTDATRCFRHGDLRSIKSEWRLSNPRRSARRRRRWPAIR